MLDSKFIKITVALSALILIAPLPCAIGAAFAEDAQPSAASNQPTLSLIHI